MSTDLYARLPAWIRSRDLEEGRRTGRGPALDALLAVMAGERDAVAEDVERLYRNLFIETCDEWVVPYIGDLLGVRGLSSYGDDFSLRAYVANTLGYRRAKGTAAVLEQLARDVTGWNARVVEFFTRLGQTQNVNHVRPDNLHTVDLHDADAAELVGGPFESAAHTVDVRSIARGRGRYNIPHVGIFLWRLQAYAMGFVSSEETGLLGGVTPRAASSPADGRYHFDPLGADRPLFNDPQTEDGLAHVAREIHVPTPLRRRPLHEELRSRRDGNTSDDGWFGLRRVLKVRLDGVDVDPTALHCCDLADQDDGGGGVVWTHADTAGEVHFDPVRGRLSLHPDDVGKSLEVAYAYGFAADLGGGPYDRQDSIERWWDTLAAGTADADLWQIGVTRRAEDQTEDLLQGGPVVGSVATALERWNAEAQPGTAGIVTILDSASYDEDLTTAARRIALPAGARLAIVAAGWPTEEAGPGLVSRRVGRLVPQDRRPHLQSALRVAADDGASGGTLVLDGLLVEGGLDIEAGDLRHLVVAHATIGASAAGLDARIVVDDNPELSVTVDASIVGGLEIPDMAGTITLRDSLVGEDRAAGGGLVTTTGLVVDTPASDVTIERCTLFGETAARTLHADTSLFTGLLDIARRQEGCVRFSSVPPGSRTPRRYRCQPDLAQTVAAERLAAESEASEPPTLTDEEREAIAARTRPDFTSSRFGESAFGQLARRCPVEIREGGDGGTEMGALAGLHQPQREANLHTALDEYLRFGLEAGALYMT